MGMEKAPYIYIIDDDEQVSRVLEILLAQNGFEVGAESSCPIYERTYKSITFCPWNCGNYKVDNSCHRLLVK